MAATAECRCGGDGEEPGADAFGLMSSSQARENRGDEAEPVRRRGTGGGETMTRRRGRGVSWTDGRRWRSQSTARNQAERARSPGARGRHTGPSAARLSLVAKARSRLGLRPVAAGAEVEEIAATHCAPMRPNWRFLPTSAPARRSASASSGCARSRSASRWAACPSIREGPAPA
jgi:hypothetical protein